MRYLLLPPGATIRGSTDQFFTHVNGWVNTGMPGMKVPARIPYRRLIACWKRRVSMANPAPSLR